MKIEPLKMVARGVLAALLLLPAVGCSDSSDAEESADPTARVEVDLGKEFTWNDFTVSDGWKLETTTQVIELEEHDQPYILGEVTNDADEARFAIFEVVFVADGDLQATIHCTSQKLAKDETGDLSCPGLGQSVPQGYDLIQAQEITR